MPEHSRMPISVLPEQWRQLFPYTPPYFNRMQSECFEAAFQSDHSIVISSPTGSGKTAVLEMAMARLFTTGAQASPTRSLAVYMAPLKSLCHERLLDWQRKLQPLNLKVVELTGDSSDETDERAVAAADCIVTTPEKWDAFSRFRRDAQGVVGRVGLLLVDEVHQITDPSRGPTLESVIARMMTISQGAEVRGMPIARLRVLAASATIANAEDLQAWLGPSCVVRQFDESYRPVPLSWRVLTYPMHALYTFDKALIANLPAVVREHAAGRPTLVFCQSRNACKQAATGLSTGPPLVHSQPHHAHLAQAAARVRDQGLAALVRVGCAYHDSSLEIDDRRLLEALFAEGALPVLACTSGLAQGVNLPARLVVVMNTAKYSKALGGYEELTRIEVLQMAGRAGRPQFDQQGVCVVMTRNEPEVRQRYERMLGGTEVIESQLHENQLVHLNAEIAQTCTYMSDVTVCLRWLKSTYFFTRIRRNPTHYGYRMPTGPGPLDERALDAHLTRLLMGNLRALGDAGMILMSEDGLGVQPQPLGTLMARYCVAFETVKSFVALENGAGLEAVLRLLAHSDELDSLYLRHNEKKKLFELNSNKELIRFPFMDGAKRSKIKSTAMKASLLLQLRVGGHPLPSEFHSAEFTLEQSGARITNALVEYLVQQERAASALHAALVLRRSLQQKSIGWYDDPQAGLRQLDGVGPVMVQKLKDAGAGSLEALAAMAPSLIERACNKAMPFGAVCLRAVRALLAAAPRLTAEVGAVAQLDLLAAAAIQSSDEDDEADDELQRRQVAPVVALDDSSDEDAALFGDAPSSSGRQPAAGAPPAPVLVYLHGGYWKPQWGVHNLDTTGLFAAFGTDHVATWSVEYARVDQLDPAASVAGAATPMISTAIEPVCARRTMGSIATDDDEFKQWAETNPEAAAAMARGLRRWLAWISEAPAEVVRIWLEAHDAS
ncbi:putative ATP-dependent DNA helicase hfm1-like protein [Chrysochromulina tobinii]|uniref:Putative ATP-dependent DNA helicase hfm1-like protein n=1 Tax=Chrysochromulina tobinii TaxID=1460289 RepID=A0A0M0K2K5_9EUKA|nr:putative ATP-dependent DNA helicase hfm1-like protein [Chrysochromulina tobinii]|eukprot:KOO33035.1 putative ATP-dependent DNA helicase hfm1-like protein [Chrysochromulina sp. CCMP291]